MEVGVKFSKFCDRGPLYFSVLMSRHYCCCCCCLGLDSQYLRKTEKGFISLYLALCATGEGSLVIRAHGIIFCPYVNCIRSRISNFHIE